MRRPFAIAMSDRQNYISDPRFWYIAALLVFITIHHYDAQTGIAFFTVSNKVLGLTRHSIDRILYLIPIILGGFYFGAKGGFATLGLALAAMLPRALFITGSAGNALSEMLIVGIIGALLSTRIERFHKQGAELEVVTERLQTTQRRLHSKVRMSMEQAKQLAVIKSFSAILSQSDELENVIQHAVSMVMEVIQVEIVLIFRLDAKTQTLHIVAHQGIDEESKKGFNGIKLGEGLCGCVAKTGEPLFVEDVSSDERFCNMTVKNEKIKSQLSVPLASKHKIMGTLCVATRAPRTFNEPEIKLLGALGNLIGVAIENSELNRDHEIAADKILLSEKRYRQLFENAHDAIWMQDLSGIITAANEATSEIFGYGQAELIGKSMKDILSRKGLRLAKELQGRLLSGEQARQPYTQKLLRKDGKEIILMLTTNLISSNGHATHLQFIGRDITNELRMQENQQFYLEQITKAHEEERFRISRDLHDSTAQSLIASIHQLEEFCQADQDLPMPRLRALLGLREQLKDILQEIRQVSRDLRPSIIDDLGILPAVEWLTEQIKKDHQLDTSLTIIGDEHRFSPEIELTVFRIVQEALRNTVKHAQATRADVTIEFKPDETRIEVADDGKGFDMPKSLGEFSRLGKLGVDGMLTRARLVNATLDMSSNKGERTTLTLSIPVR